MKTNSVKTYLALYLLLFLMALSGVLSKLASQQPFLSFLFFAYYLLMLLLLGVYAIGWQQIIKRMPLSVAYANRGCSLVFSLIFGSVIFHEAITWNKVVGCALAMAGVLLYVSGSKEDM